MTSLSRGLVSTEPTLINSSLVAPSPLSQWMWHLRKRLSRKAQRKLKEKNKRYEMSRRYKDWWGRWSCRSIAGLRFRIKQVTFDFVCQFSYFTPPGMHAPVHLVPQSSDSLECVFFVLISLRTKSCKSRRQLCLRPKLHMQPDLHCPIGQVRQNACAVNPVLQSVSRAKPT